MTKRIFLFGIFAVLGSKVFGQGSLSERPSLAGRWQVGIHLGELPLHGSFKLGFQVGYHFSDLAYVGFAYQAPDRIQRGGSSFNARAIGLDGLTKSSETVGTRMMLQTRLRPHRLAPYVSLGMVYNSTDTETIQFDGRTRKIGSRLCDGPLTIVQRRPEGLKPSIGLGYSYTLDSGVAVYTEWAGWWLRGAPRPEVSIRGPQLETTDDLSLVERITQAFQASPFNTYHMFQAGVGYTF